MINSRVIPIFIGISIFLILLIFKLFEIQILKNEESIFYTERQQNRTENIRAERGLIYDRNDILLVYNRNDITFFFDKNLMNDRKPLEIANQLSSFFKNKRSYYTNLLKDKSSTVCVEKKIPNEKGLLSKKLELKGLYYRDDPTRIYHYNNLASHVIGYVDEHFCGVDGIENYFNNNLKGVDGVRLVERSAAGRMITVKEDETKSSVPGFNIQLTIDKKFQTILEEELRKGVKAYQASSALGIMMNPANGEILALANIGDYDPNNYSDYDDYSRKNRCITDLYEPGSTIKAITLAALLDQELCKESELVNVENGRFVFKGKVIADAHPHKILSVRGILEQSSNVGMVKLIQRMDDETLFKYLRGFGFGTPTGIELPGEVKGTLNKPSDWSLVSKAFLSFGYELSATPIQMITAFSALVNGGIIYQPQIVKKLISPLADEDVEIKAREIRRIISQKTSDRIKDLLASVVTNGTGQKAQLDKIDVGGKTGTSKILVNGKYSSTKYNSSFIGFYPVENPQVVCLILVNSPKVGGYGGLVAAPIFKEITKRALTSLQESYQNESKESLKNEEINLIKTKAIEEQTELHEQVEIVNAINRNTLSPDFMPDLRNYSLREALVVLTKLGVKHQIIGSGKIISQSIMPGYKIKKGMICKITCSQQSKKSVSN